MSSTHIGTSSSLMKSLSIPSQGRLYDLELERFPGMPQYEGHPPFTVLTYRSPQGMRIAGDEEWLTTNNDVNLHFVSELMMCTAHSGAHVDAPAHITVGEDDHWHGGATAREYLGDYGPQVGDATVLPPFISRGILVDVARYLKMERLPAAYSISLDEFNGALDRAGLSIRSGDVVLVRTGQLSIWPDKQALAETFGAGIGIEVAELCLAEGVTAVGSDSAACEAMPSSVAGHPHPVHDLFLVKNEVSIFENLYLEDLSRGGIVEFLFLALPLKVRGATGSMVRPIVIT